MLTTHILTVLAAPSPTPTGGTEKPGADVLMTQDIITFLATMIAPILLAVLGVYFIGRARKGRVSEVVTSGGISIVGLIFIAGAGGFFILGEKIVALVFPGN